MILGIIAIVVIMCIIILCVIILGVVILGVVFLTLLGVAKFIMWALVIWIANWNCWNYTYTEQDFADSKWEDSYGTVIELNKDGTCDVRDIKWDLILLPHSTWLEDSVSKEKCPEAFVGHWTIKTNQLSKQDIYIRIGAIGYETSFKIKDKNTIEEAIVDYDKCECYTLTRTR